MNTIKHSDEEEEEEEEEEQQGGGRLKSANGPSWGSIAADVGLTCGESPLPTGFMWLLDAEGLMKVSE